MHLFWCFSSFLHVDILGTGVFVRMHEPLVCRGSVKRKILTIIEECTLFRNEAGRCYLTFVHSNMAEFGSIPRGWYWGWWCFLTGSLRRLLYDTMNAQRRKQLSFLALKTRHLCKNKASLSGKRVAFYLLEFFKRNYGSKNCIKITGLF